MLDPGHFRRHVIDPTLRRIELYSPEASDLLLGTALAESGLRKLVQTAGPALGLFQIEPRTFDSLRRNYLRYRPGLARKLKSLLARAPTPRKQLVTNLVYATAMARVRYLPWPEAIPKTTAGQAAYHLVAYNRGGAATIGHYMGAWRDAGLEVK